jgi:hypothetical protein
MAGTCGGRVVEFAEGNPDILFGAVIVDRSIGEIPVEGLIAVERSPILQDDTAAVIDL